MEKDTNELIEFCPKGHKGGRGRGSANFPGGKTMWEKYFKWAIKHDSTQGLINFHRYLVMIYIKKTGKNISVKDIKLEGNPDDYAEIIDIKDAPQWVKDIEDKLPPQDKNPYSVQDLLTLDDWVIEELRRRFKAAGKKFTGQSIREKLRSKKAEISGEFISLQSQKGVRYKHKLIGIGKYKYQGSDWEVNYEYLKKLKENTEKALALGVEIPVTISHPKTSIDYTIYKVGNLVGLELTDLWLWGIFEIEDPETVEKIENGIWDKVSVAIKEIGLETIHGEKIEPPCIDHVAITAINAIPDQGVFIRLEKARKGNKENVK